MIIDALLNILHGLLSWLISVRPVWEVHLPGSVGSLIGALKGFDQILPVTETCTCVALMTTLFLATTGFKWFIKIVDYVADVIP